jgi:hypothetical protein
MKLAWEHILLGRFEATFGMDTDRNNLVVVKILHPYPPTAVTADEHLYQLIIPTENVLYPFTGQFINLDDTKDFCNTYFKNKEKYQTEKSFTTPSRILRPTWGETIANINKLRDAYYDLKTCGTRSPLQEPVEDTIKTLYAAVEEVLKIFYGDAAYFKNCRVL